MASGKWRPSCLGLHVLTNNTTGYYLIQLAPLSYTTWFTLGLAASAVYKQFLLWLNPTLFPQVGTKFYHMNNTIYWQVN